MNAQIVKASEFSQALETPLRIQDVLEQVKLIQQVMKDVMKEGEHYGTIPGCGPKPALLKPGAEKICFTFRLAPEYEITEHEGERGHREYRVLCTLRTPNGRSVGQGVGACSTMESKYRFRTGPKEATRQPVPHEYWNARKTDPAAALEMIGGKGHIVAKEDGIWQIFIQGEKVENDNPADHYNTVLKMAKKRAHVDAVLTATAASDIFTQDVEEVAGNLKAVQGEEVEAPKAQPEPAIKTWRDVKCKAGLPGGDILGKTLGQIAEATPHRMQDLYNRFVDEFHPDYVRTINPRDKELAAALVEWGFEQKHSDHIPGLEPKEEPL